MLLEKSKNRLLAGLEAPKTLLTIEVLRTHIDFLVSESGEQR